MEGYLHYIMEGIYALEKAGADFIIIAANSPHAVFEKIEKKAKVPLLSIVNETTKAIKKAKVKKILLLGIKFIFTSGFYQKALEKAGIKVIVPNESEQDVIHQIIFNELNIGIVKDESREIILEIIQNYDAEAVVLGCTILPSLIQEKHLSLPLFDTTEIHTDAVLQYALN